MAYSLNIFKNDGFSHVKLQKSIGLTPYIPQALGNLQLFKPVPSASDIINLYEEDGGFALIPTSKRGAPDAQAVRRSGHLRSLETLRLSKKDTLRAGELTGVSDEALPESFRLPKAANLLAARHSDLKTDMEATKEFHRLGALRGKLYDIDGTTLLVDFHAEYGIATPAPVAFNFASIGAGNLGQYIERNVKNPILDALARKGRVTPATRVCALIGDNGWYGLTSHVDVRDRWKAMELVRPIDPSSNPLLNPKPRYESIEVGGVLFIHYRNSVGSDNSEVAVGTNEMIFFPAHAKDVFQVFWAPGETIHDAGQEGRPEYAYLQADPNEAIASYIDTYVRSYPLYACTFPGALMTGQVAS